MELSDHTQDTANKANPHQGQAVYQLRSPSQPVARALIATIAARSYFCPKKPPCTQEWAQSVCYSIRYYVVFRQRAMKRVLRGRNYVGTCRLIGNGYCQGYTRVCTRHAGHRCRTVRPVGCRRLQCRVNGSDGRRQTDDPKMHQYQFR